jgi:hypothetical protein
MSATARLVAGGLPGPRLALVVAVGSYEDPALERLEAAARDAEQMTEVLRDPRIGGFAVTQLVDCGEQEIRRRAAEFLAGCPPDGIVVVYLSCHGILDAWGRLYFAAADTDTRDEKLPATAVASAWLLERLEDCRAGGQVLILDCCHSGAAVGGAKGADGGLRLAQRLASRGRGRWILTASRAAERSWEHGAQADRPGPSVFTRALAEGLRTGSADADHDGYISVAEAYQWAYREVIASGAAQTPQIDISRGEGTLWLARNPLGASTRKRIITRRSLAACAIVAIVLLTALALAVRTASAQTVHVYSGPGYHLDGPDAVAVDGDHVWVANSVGNSVTELSSIDGEPIRTVSSPAGSYGSGYSDSKFGSVNKHGFDDPVAIAVGGDHVWVANSEGNSVTELDASDGRQIRTIYSVRYAFDRPAAIAAADDRIWVADAGGDSVTELDADTGGLIGVLSGSSYQFDGPDALTVDGGHVWVVNYDGTLTELNGGDGKPVRNIPADFESFNGPDAIAAVGPYIWVANPESASITELSTRDGRLVRTLSVGNPVLDEPHSPLAMAAAGTHIWVTGEDGTSVTELNAADGSKPRTVTGGRYRFDIPYAITAAGSDIWVANEKGDSLTELPAG